MYTYPTNRGKYGNSVLMGWMISKVGRWLYKLCSKFNKNRGLVTHLVVQVGQGAKIKHLGYDMSPVNGVNVNVLYLYI